MDWYEAHFLPPGADAARRVAAARPSGSPASRPRSSSPRGSTRCATRARPTRRGCATPACATLLRRHPGQVHGFLNLTGIGTATREAIAEMGGVARALLTR